MSNAKIDLEDLRAKIKEQGRKLAAAEAEYASAQDSIVQIEKELLELGFKGPRFDDEIQAAEIELARCTALLNEQIEQMEHAVEEAYANARSQG